MSYDEFVLEYERLVAALLEDDTPKVEGMIFSKAQETISSSLADLCEAHPKFEKIYEEVLYRNALKALEI